MLEEEKEIDNKKFKPTTPLYIFLFIFYCIWIWNIWGYAKYCLTFGIVEVRGLSIFEITSGICLLVTSVIGFYSIIKTLRGDKDCITSLKWALVYAFIFALVDENRIAVPTNSLTVLWVVFLVKPLFYLSFYLYLCFPKAIKSRFPKQERRFGRAGWIWVGITVCFIGLSGWAAYTQYSINQYCKRANLEELNLQANQYSDGYIILNSPEHWTKIASQEPEEPEETDDVLWYSPSLQYNNTLKQETYIVFAGRCDKYSERVHNIILTRLLKDNADNLREIGHQDTIVSGNRLLATRYVDNSDSIPVFYSIATLAENENPKIAVISYAGQSDYGSSEIIKIAEGISFNIQSRLVKKSVDKESGNRQKNKVENRIENNHEQASPEAFGGILKCLRPGLPRSIVLLQYAKRIETQCQRYDRCEYRSIHSSTAKL